MNLKYCDGIAKQFTVGVKWVLMCNLIWDSAVTLSLSVRIFWVNMLYMQRTLTVSETGCILIMILPVVFSCSNCVVEPSSFFIIFLRIHFIVFSRFLLTKTNGLSEILPDIRTSTYQICRIEKKINRKITFYKLLCNLTPETRDLLKMLCRRHFVTYC